MPQKQILKRLSTEEFCIQYRNAFGTDAAEKLSAGLQTGCPLLQSALQPLADDAYKMFHCRLIPTVPSEYVMGVRTPQLRKLARIAARWNGAAEFRTQLPHTYYEENNLHAFMIEQLNDFEDTVHALNLFLPYVDNWATCDMLRPKVFGTHLTELLPKIHTWIASDATYAVRFGIEMLMCYYLEDTFDPTYLNMVATLRSKEYYIRMMIAWYFATALAKQYKATLPYLTENRLDTWTHNRTIQKAVESFRITDEQKLYLRTLKR